MTFAKARKLLFFSIFVGTFSLFPLIKAPQVHASVLYSQTDESGTPVDIKGYPNYPYWPTVWPSFSFPSGSPSTLYLRLKVAVTAPNALGHETYAQLAGNSNGHTGGSYGFTDSAANGDDSGCVPSDGLSHSLATYDCAVHMSAIPATGTTLYIGIVNGQFNYYDHWVTQADGSGNPYMILTETQIPPNTSFYSPIANTSSGYNILYSASSTSSAQLKQLPNDWVLNISTTTDSLGNAVLADGYDWYQVTDPTDGVSGWMEGKNASTTVEYLPYFASQQSSFEATSSDQISTTSDRAAKIMEAVDHYYNNSDTTPSLYSSDDASNNISSLVTNGFPEEVIPGIIATETGGVDFDNEYIHYDYGHGIMQITPYEVFSHEPLSSGDWAYNSGDNRGFASGIKIYPCTSNDSELYANCYTHGGEADSVDSKSYQPYAGVSGQPEYKYYTNTPQSIYANIKDGMQTLAIKSNQSFINDIATSTTVGTTTYSAADRKTILTTEGYVGDRCSYVSQVAANLSIINTYFSTATTSGITDLMEKMDEAGSNSVCADLHSPATLSIQDSKGNTVGVVNGKGVNDFPLAVFDDAGKFVKILAAQDDNYTYRVEGTAKATYGLDITIKNGNQEAVFHARGIPTDVGEVHTYRVNKASLLAGLDNAITIEVQPTDNTATSTITAGSSLTGAEFLNKEQNVEQISASTTPVTAESDDSATSTTTDQSADL